MLKNKSFYGIVGTAIILITLVIYTLTPPATTNSGVAKTPLDWQTHVSQSMGFGLAYPQTMDVREYEDGSVTFVLLGPTQSKNTEILDGVSINFSSNAFKGDFKEFVDKDWQLKKEEEEIYQEVGTIKEVTYANTQGYSYTVRSLGDFDLIFLPTDDNSYLQITLLVEDPKNQGFREISYKILETLAIK